MATKKKAKAKGQVERLTVGLTLWKGEENRPLEVSEPCTCRTCRLASDVTFKVS
jgi:hypothetical protein